MNTEFVQIIMNVRPTFRVKHGQHGGKMCQECGSRLTTHKILNWYGRPHASYIFDKIYRCEICFGEYLVIVERYPHMTYEVHVYCYLCGEMYRSREGDINSNIRLHVSNFHKYIADLCLFSPKRLLDSISGLVYSSLQYLVEKNPQFIVIVSDNTKPTQDLEHFLEDIHYKGNYILNADKSHEWSYLILECLKLPSRTYSCVFCGEEYDALPSLKVVRAHIKICTAIKQLHDPSVQPPSSRN